VRTVKSAKLEVRDWKERQDRGVVGLKKGSLGRAKILVQCGDSSFLNIYGVKNEILITSSFPRLEDARVSFK